MSYLSAIPRPTVHMPQIQLVRLVPNMNFLPNENNDLISDEEGKAQRADILKRQKINTTFYGLQQIFTFISGPLIGAGLGILLPQLTKGPGFWDKAANLLSGAGAQEGGLLAALAAPEATLGLGLIGAAAISIGVAIASNQIASRVMHSANFDQSEINAQHTAKYVGKAIRHELEDMQAQQSMVGAQSLDAAPQVVIFDNPDAQRADGKKWVEAENIRIQQAANITQQLS